MEKNENQKLIEKLELAENNIIKNITDLYIGINKKVKSGNIPEKEVSVFNQKILKYISDEFTKIKKDLNCTPIEDHIESKHILNIFTSEDIEKKNLEITKIFQKEAFNRVNDDEEEENQGIADFFFRVAKIARIAFLTGKELLFNIKKLFFEYKESIGKTIIVKREEDFNREFSCWVKEKEEEEEKIRKKIENKDLENAKEEVKKEIKGVKENELNLSEIYKKILKKDKEKIDEETDDKTLKDFLSQIFESLALMYFHCYLSFPLVKINFYLTSVSKISDKNQENHAESISDETFNSEIMIDLINKGKNRKVNFVILPSLISNKNYLKNGKLWVFTYLRNTFKIEKKILESIEQPINSLEKSLLSDVNKKLEIIGSCEINEENEKNIIITKKPDIYEKIDIEFILYLKKEKNKKESFLLITQRSSFSVGKDYEISKSCYKIENDDEIPFEIKNKEKEKK